MANTTQPWLEDLSEEWIPQPSPDTIAREAAQTATAQTAQSVPPKARSRLPRLRQSSGSFSEIQVRSIAPELRPPKQRNALIERSLNQDNIPLPSSPKSPESDPSRSPSLSFSTSQGSVMYNGTVAHNTVAKSPAKENGAQDTPEWRRRLVHGEVGYGNQTDLFGPTGLENIFQKPAGNASEETPRPQRKLGLLKSMAAMPSSPPPWPAARNDGADQEQDELSTVGMVDTQPQRQDSPHEDSPHEDKDQSNVDPRKSSSQAPTRTVSGQIEFDNESFSPVYLTTNLKVGQIPSQTPSFRVSELANRLRQIGSPPPNHYQPAVEESALSQSREDSSFSRLQDDSLPEGLPAGTPDFADVGRFVELRRGGYSRDGSFRTRALSPSPDKLASSKSQSNPNTRPSSENTNSGIPKENSTDPKTPSRKANNQFLSPQRAKNSGSPLKLFDAHDTFTSNRLQRRLSQLEYKSDKTTASSVKGSKSEAIGMATKPSRMTSLEETSFQNPDTNPDVPSQTQQTQQAESFGEGQLSEYQFSGEFTALSLEHSDTHDDSAPDGSPPLNVAPPGSRQPFRFHVESSPVSQESSVIRRKPSARVQSSRNPSRPKFQTHRKPSSSTTHEHPQFVPEYADGKRGPTSPFKNPTPKRRRTIHSVDDDEQDADEEVFSETGLGTMNSHLAMQSIIGRKRKDARHDTSNNIADAETLARRHILRPRNPTPSQRRREEIHAEIMEATEAFILSSPKLNTIREQLESPGASDVQLEKARATEVANQVAAFSMKRQPRMQNESRKRSVTTQDFLDEALKIMDFIRTKGRPTSGLGSLEETEGESELVQDSTEHHSSSLSFERPPSREGRLSAWREPNKPQLDPKVVSHLQKYQEKETDTFLNSSVNSLRFQHIREPVEFEEESVVVEQNDIRITDNPNRHSIIHDDEPGAVDSQPRTNGTQQSTGSSLGQTVVTSASRRSDHVATLAPEAVAHLIPKEIAGMSFDQEKNIWVRQKSPSKQRYKEESSGMNASEEDPFGNIPDLTVDEIKEQEVRKYTPACPQPTSETILEDTASSEHDEERRPVTREGQGIPFTDVSSVPSKVSNFGWSYPKTETRATSWSTQAPRNWSTQKTPHAQTTYAIPESEEDIEHEIQYFEGRGHAPPSVQHTRVRDVTISFAEHEAPGSEQQTTKSPQKSNQTGWRSSTVQHKSHLKQSARKQTSDVRTLPSIRTGRLPIFTGDGDLSLLEEVPTKNYRMQLSMSVSAPVLTHGEPNALVPVPSSPMKGDVTFMLSDLPEFTLHQIDECELPDRVVVKHDGTRFSKALEDRYAQGTANLVKALQDVEPDEPFWEDLRQVDLHGKSLDSLNRLDELCYHLEDLNVSDNNIGQVKGIPYTMRRLRIQRNCLTGLTSWTTLTNLQHLDISHNEIDTLDGLAELVHLRVLNIDNNKVKSLSGILHLDGLMELSAANNKIEMVDFSRSNLKSLTNLNLRNNRLLEVRNVHHLPQLQHLDLDDNEIEEFPLFDEPAKPCKSIRSIRLCRNGTSVLDVDKHFPKIESLYVDGNCLTQVFGLEHLRYLRTFSARDQLLAADSDSEVCVNNLIQNAEVRNLYLSLNCTHGLVISQHLLSLQRLELSSMGLKELPEKFGQLTPNIRSINLNFNSLRDLRPLLNIKRLSELLLAGNKLERLRANALVLGKLDTLTKLDWRDNPLTLRFYAPTSENRVMSLRTKPSDEQINDRFVLPDGDMDEDDQHLSRLDYETRIRRRVTEMMLANLCKHLTKLDGLPFDKARVLVKDDVWERLLFLGVIQRKQPEDTDGGHE